MVPQLGTHQNYQIPHQLPEDDSLADMEPLGIIHTQAAENNQLTPFDSIMMAKLIKSGKNFDAESTICITSSFVTGSCYLTSYRLTSEGLEWAKDNQDAQNEVKGYTPSMYEKVTMILSDKFFGYFMVPEGGVWNYNFMGINFTENLKYSLVIDHPYDYYHEAHRPSHFIDFALQDDEDETEAPDRDDLFT
jgi:pre-mRNA-processing factor 8